jgi:transposase
MTKPKRYKGYSAEFKREAILRAGEEGVTDRAVCDELGISTRQFRRWRDELQLLGNDAFPGQGRTRDEEMAGLKRELSQVNLIKTIG